VVVEGCDVEVYPVKTDDAIRMFIGHDCPYRDLILKWTWLKNTWDHFDDIAY